jgi:hypothetical protein
MHFRNKQGAMSFTGSPPLLIKQPPKRFGVLFSKIKRSAAVQCSVPSSSCRGSSFLPCKRHFVSETKRSGADATAWERILCI